MSIRQIQNMTNISKSSVANYIKMYTDLGASLEEVLAFTDADLENLFFVKKSKSLQTSTASLEHPDWNEVRVELTKKGMTRLLLWEEYKEKQPLLYSYSQFNRYFNRFLHSVNPSMRQLHYSGDKLFIDYSGLTVQIVNQITGEIFKAQIFVSVLGASGYTFVHATSSQSTKDFINSHVQAFIFYGGVPNILVPEREACPWGIISKLPSYPIRKVLLF